MIQIWDIGSGFRGKSQSSYFTCRQPTSEVAVKPSLLLRCKLHLE